MRLVSSTFLGEVFQPILEGNQKSGEKTSGGYIEVGSWHPIIYKALAPSKRWLALGFLVAINTTGMLRGLWCAVCTYFRNIQGVAWKNIKPTRFFLGVKA